MEGEAPALAASATLVLPEGEQLKDLLQKMRLPRNQPEAAGRAFRQLDDAVHRLQKQRSEVEEDIATDEALVAQLSVKEAELVAAIEALTATKDAREERAKSIREKLTLAEEQIAQFLQMTRSSAMTAVHAQGRHRKAVVTSQLLKERGYSCAADDKPYAEPPKSWLESRRSASAGATGGRLGLALTGSFEPGSDAATDSPRAGTISGAVAGLSDALSGLTLRSRSRGPGLDATGASFRTAASRTLGGGGGGEEEGSAGRSGLLPPIAGAAPAGGGNNNAPLPRTFGARGVARLYTTAGPDGTPLGGTMSGGDAALLDATARDTLRLTHGSGAGGGGGGGTMVPASSLVRQTRTSTLRARSKSAPRAPKLKIIKMM